MPSNMPYWHSTKTQFSFEDLKGSATRLSTIKTKWDLYPKSGTRLAKAQLLKKYII